MSAGRRAVNKVSLLGLLLLAALPARAQFAGVSVPQTITTTAFSNTSCTGSTQTATIANLAQAEHFITLTMSGVLGIRVTVQGSHDGATWNDISDVATNSGTTVMGQGYYPIVRVAVQCLTAAGTFTVQYSGQANGPGNQIGGQFSSQVDKTLASAAPANATLNTNTIRTPFGSSGGQIYFQYSGAGPSGSTLTIGCTSQSIFPTLANVASFPIGTGAGVQSFSVPSLPCDFVGVTYNSGGASAQTFTISYVFTQQTINGADPCAGGVAPKTTVVISVGAAATTQLLAGVAGHVIYACGYSFTAATGTGATYQFEGGTGASCTTPTVTSGAMIGNNGPQEGAGGYTLMKTAAGQSFCLVTAGTSPSAQGWISLVQQ